MFRTRMVIIVALAAFFTSELVTAQAAETPALKAAILRLALEWEQIKFQEADKDLQERQMATLASRAAELAKQYQGQPEAQIWLGIIISEQASMAGENGSPLKALGFDRDQRHPFASDGSCDEFWRNLKCPSPRPTS